MNLSYQFWNSFIWNCLIARLFDLGFRFFVSRAICTPTLLQIGCRMESKSTSAVFCMFFRKKLNFFFAHENMRTLPSNRPKTFFFQYYQPVQNQPKYLFCSIKKVSLRNFYTLTLITRLTREKLLNFLYLSTKTSNEDLNHCPFTAIYSITYQQRLQGCFVFFLFSFGYCISQRLWFWILIDQRSHRNSEFIYFSSQEKLEFVFLSEFWLEKPKNTIGILE